MMLLRRVFGTALKYTFILLVIGVLICEANKAYWDYKVARWCKEDGGVTVYHKVELTQEEYEKNGGKNGRIPIRPENSSLENEEYAYTSKIKIIHESNPEVWRSEDVTYRKLDGKKLGKLVHYVRRNGDFPTGFHPSNFSCRDLSKYDTQAEIFSIKGN